MGNYTLYINLSSASRWDWVCIRSVHTCGTNFLGKVRASRMCDAGCNEIKTEQWEILSFFVPYFGWGLNTKTCASVVLHMHVFESLVKCVTRPNWESWEVVYAHERTPNTGCVFSFLSYLSTVCLHMRLRMHLCVCVHSSYLFPSLCLPLAPHFAFLLSAWCDGHVEFYLITYYSSALSSGSSLPSQAILLAFLLLFFLPKSGVEANRRG